MTFFKYIDAYLLVNRVKPNPRGLLAHNETLAKGALAQYNLTRVELKTFTFSSGAQSLSIENAVLGPGPKRLLFTMVNTDFLGSLNKNPFNFRHYDLRSFTLNVNGKQIPAESVTLNTDHEKTCHGLQDAFRGVGHPPLELGTPDNSRYVCKLLFHVAFRLDT